MAKGGAQIEVRDLAAGYGKREVLIGVSFLFPCTQITAVIGHNGSGKSTLLKCLIGLVRESAGAIFMDDRNLHNVTVRDRIRSGISYVPQGGRVFGDLTVRENLLTAAGVVAVTHDAEARLDCLLAMFPGLKSLMSRRGNELSGGERQLVSLANALVVAPRVLLVDEPALGLAPKLATRVLDQLRQMRNEVGQTIIVVEQRVRDVLRIADRVCVLRDGRVVFSGPTAALDPEEKAREIFL